MDTNIEETNKTIDTTASTIATEPDVKPNEQISSEEFKISGDLFSFHQHSRSKAF